MTKDEYVLGVNGWPTRSHDASACIVKNGELLIAAEEERFTRRKHSYDKAPLNAIAWCLSSLGLTVDDISILATGWDYKKLYRINKQSEPSTKTIIETFLPPQYFSYTKVPKLCAVEHHLAHAASSYYLSGMDTAAIIVADGEGEGEATSFWYGHNGRVTRINSLSTRYSLGYFYEYISENLGMGRDGAGKTMGLSSYGNPDPTTTSMRTTKDGYDVNIPDISSVQEGKLDSQDKIIKAWEDYYKRQRNTSRWHYDHKRTRLVQTTVYDQESKNFAASAQYMLETALIGSASAITKQLNVKKLCLSGGVALNCSANSQLISIPGVDELFIPPFPHDGGVSIGAALYASSPSRAGHLASPYLGPSFTSNQIEESIKESGYKYTRPVSIEQETAKLLAKGRVVGWFMGSMEFGPRALGNRSILASPASINMRDRINTIKHREGWRPFAPSVIREYAGEYFNEGYESPYMLRTYTVKADKVSSINAVVHYDNTTRAQTVSKNDNPRYYKLLQEFKNITDIPMLLNTSFNGREEPIVCSPKDAIRTFSTHDIDALAIGDFLIEKMR